MNHIFNKVFIHKKRKKIMNKQLNTAIASLFLVATSTVATATEVGDTYVTAGMMNVTYDGVNELAAAGVTIDDSDRVPTFGIGYQVDENLSLEAGVVGEADVSATLSGGESGTLYGQSYSLVGSATIKATTDTSYTLGVRYIEPVSEKLDLYGKAGMLFWDLTGSVGLNGTLTYAGTQYTVNTTADFYQNDGSDLYYGIGGAYELDKETSINADYLKMEIDGDDIDGLSVTIEFDI